MEFEGAIHALMERFIERNSTGVHVAISPRGRNFEENLSLSMLSKTAMRMQPLGRTGHAEGRKDTMIAKCGEVK
jgi:hypothetical protein